MYESFYRLKARPFAAAPQIQSYFPSEAIEQARQTCIRVIERAEGPALIVGPPGVGKTLLCRLLGAYFDTVFQVALLSSAQLSTHKSLLQNILFELKLPYREMDEGELRLQLINYLQPSDECPHGILLIIDEASAMPIRLLEEMRILTNVVGNGQPRVRLVLAGNSRLDERFAHPRLESFNQRVAARCYLQAMSRTETDDYVRAQLSFAGGSADMIFAEDAFRAIYQATDGIPRLVNQVCNHTLTLSCQAGHRKIDAEKVSQAWADLQQLPAPWQEKKAETDNEHAFIEFGQLDDEPSSASSSEGEPSAAPISGSPQVDPMISAVARCGEVVEFVASGEADEHPSIIFGSLGANIESARSFEPLMDDDDELPDSPVDESPASAEAPEQPAVPLAANPFDTPFDEEEIIVDRLVAEPATAAKVAAPKAIAPKATAGESENKSEYTRSRIDSAGQPRLKEPASDADSAPVDIGSSGAGASSSANGGLAEVTGSRTDESVFAQDSAEENWESLLTILPSAANEPLLAGAGLPAMFEFTILETAPGEGMVLDTSGEASNPASSEDAGQVARPAQRVDQYVPFSTPRPPHHDDRDLIQVHDDEEPIACAGTGESVKPDVRRMEYRELFAQLRRKP